MRQLSFHLEASQRGLEAAAVLMALYAGAHATLPTDATAQLPPRHHREALKQWIRIHLSVGRPDQDPDPGGQKGPSVIENCEETSNV
jgi:hypothetical protein